MTDYFAYIPPYEAGYVNLAGSTILDRQYLSRHRKHQEILNLLIFVIFPDVATADTNTKASSKMQTEEPVDWSIGPVDKGEMGFQRRTIV